MTVTRISIPVSQEEVEALITLAQRELRHPRDQARLMLRMGLGLSVGGEPPNSSKTKNDGAVDLLADDNGAASTAL